MRCARFCLSLLVVLALSDVASAAPRNPRAAIGPHVGVRDRRRRSRGKIVLAYLDVGTIEKGRPWYHAASRYRLDYWPNWGEWYADVAAPGFRKLISGTVGPSMLHKGFDGLFLDNTDMIETHPRQTAGMRTLVRRLARLLHRQGRSCSLRTGRTRSARSCPTTTAGTARTWTPHTTSAPTGMCASPTARSRRLTARCAESPGRAC